MYITYLWDFNVYDCNNKNICKPRRGQIICQPADQHFDLHCNIYPTFKLHLSQLVQSQFRSIYRIVNQLKNYLSAERLPNNYPFLYPVLPNFLSRIVIYLKKKLKQISQQRSRKHIHQCNGSYYTKNQIKTSQEIQIKYP